ncbi:hypothetical protein V6N13_121809 [Hibiscus sabdariffa]|uniref:Prefoldin subunit 2 n=1 Tax=Hibiscus sabdariffa TaxID=183260 RepID=A0ABR2C6S3_9ROSI
MGQKAINEARPKLFGFFQVSKPNHFSSRLHLTTRLLIFVETRHFHLFSLHLRFATSPTLRPREKMASKSESKEPENEQVIANMYAAMRSELNQIYSKITELEMEVSEHSLVINAIQPLDSSRRCYRMIGGVLVERTVKEVLPAVQRNKEGLEEVISWLNETLEKKKKDIVDFETKYKIRIKKSDDDAKDESGKKEGSAQGVLVGPASSSQ